jgi:hypothetical protein
VSKWQLHPGQFEDRGRAVHGASKVWTRMILKVADAISLHIFNTLFAGRVYNTFGRVVLPGHRTQLATACKSCNKDNRKQSEF